MKIVFFKVNSFKFYVLFNRFFFFFKNAIKTDRNIRDKNKNEKGRTINITVKAFNRQILLFTFTLLADSQR